MKTIEIKAGAFFEFLKTRDASMWDIFAEMIDGEEKEIIFLDDEDKILFNYILPNNPEKLAEDKKLFAAQYANHLIKKN